MNNINNNSRSLESYSGMPTPFVKKQKKEPSLSHPIFLPGTTQNIAQLPDVLLVEIFFKISSLELFRLKEVSKKFKEIVEKPALLIHRSFVRAYLYISKIENEKAEAQTDNDKGLVQYYQKTLNRVYESLSAACIEEKMFSQAAIVMRKIKDSDVLKELQLSFWKNQVLADPKNIDVYFKKLKQQKLKKPMEATEDLVSFLIQKGALEVAFKLLKTKFVKNVPEATIKSAFSLIAHYAVLGKKWDLAKNILKEKVAQATKSAIEQQIKEDEFIHLNFEQFQKNKLEVDVSILAQFYLIQLKSSRMLHTEKFHRIIQDKILKSKSLFHKFRKDFISKTFSEFIEFIETRAETKFYEENLKLLDFWLSYFDRDEGAHFLIDEYAEAFSKLMNAYYGLTKNYQYIRNLTEKFLLNENLSMEVLSPIVLGLHRVKAVQLLSVYLAEAIDNSTWISKNIEEQYRYLIALALLHARVGQTIEAKGLLDQIEEAAVKYKELLKSPEEIAFLVASSFAAIGEPDQGLRILSSFLKVVKKKPLLEKAEELKENLADFLGSINDDTISDRNYLEWADKKLKKFTSLWIQNSEQLRLIESPLEEKEALLGLETGLEEKYREEILREKKRSIASFYEDEYWTDGMKSSSLFPHVLKCFRSIISAYLKANQPYKAVKVIQDYRLGEIEPSLVEEVALAFEKKGEFHSVHKLFELLPTLEQRVYGYLHLIRH